MMEYKEPQFSYGFSFNHSSELRFKEIELIMFVEEMEKRFGIAAAKEYIAKLFQVVSDIPTEDIYQMVDDLDRNYMKPQKHERVLFFLYFKGLTQYRMRKITTISPNYIQSVKERFEGDPHQIHPQNMDIAIQFYPYLMELKNVLAIFPQINFEK